MPFTIVRNDIIKMKVDVIVNAANTALRMGSGVCGSIFKAAGAAELQIACNKLAPIKTGEAVMTPGFNLPAKYIIHTAGPVYKSGKHGEAELLRSCYLHSLELAVKSKCESIAFPLISSGIYGYPKEEALRIATSTIYAFLANYEIDVYLVVFDSAAFSVSEQLLGVIDSYIDQHYVDKRMDKRQRQDCIRIERSMQLDKEVLSAPAQQITFLAEGLDDLVGNLDEQFGQTLLRLIDAKERSDVDIYKRANIDRRLFSKIRVGKGYMPGKRTVIALAVALELTLGETEDLLKRAGYALTHSQKSDVIIEYFIINQKYNIFEINEVLFHYDQPLLGG